MRDFFDAYGFVVALALALVAVVFAIAAVVQTIPEDPRPAYAASCRAHGGHTYQPGTIMFCLTEDGRMLEVPAK